MGQDSLFTVATSDGHPLGAVTVNVDDDCRPIVHEAAAILRAAQDADRNAILSAAHRIANRVRPRPVEAHARSDDPETSKAAAESLDPDQLRRSQADVLWVLRSFGRTGATDEQLVEAMHAAAAHGEAGVRRYRDVRRQSPSGIRSRRAELVAGGLVVDTGRRERLRSGRMAVVWAFSETPQVGP